MQCKALQLRVASYHLYCPRDRGDHRPWATGQTAVGLQWAKRVAHHASGVADVSSTTWPSSG